MNREVAATIPTVASTYSNAEVGAHNERLRSPSKADRDAKPGKGTSGSPSQESGEAYLI